TFAMWQHAREMVRRFDGQFFRFDQGEVAIVDTGATHQTAERTWWINLQLPQQRLIEEGSEAFGCDVGDDKVLRRRDAEIPGPVVIRQAGRLYELIRRDAPDRHCQPDRAQSRLLLRHDTQMIRCLVVPRVRASREQRPAESPFQFSTESCN